MEIGIKN